MDKCCHITTFMRSCRLHTEHDTLQIRTLTPTQHIRSYGCGEVEDAVPESSFWQDVAYFVRNGEAQDRYKIGDIFKVDHLQFGTIEFEVVGFDQHTPVDTSKTHTMALLTKHTIAKMYFDAPELRYAVTKDKVFDAYKLFNATVAGTTAPLPFVRCGDTLWRARNGRYEFAIEDGVYKVWNINRSTHVRGTLIDEQVTPAAESPVQGTWKSTTVANPTTVYYTKSGNSYPAATVVNGDAVPDGMYYELIPQATRISRGYSNWKVSNIRQWLNSDAPIGEWYEQQHIWDQPPTDLNTLPGFVHDIVDFDFVQAVCPVRNITVRDYNTDTGGFDVTEDKFFLPSRTEVFSGTTNGVAEGVVLTKYKGASNEGRHKTTVDGEDALWWTRSDANNTSSSVVRVRSGLLTNATPNTVLDVAVMCVIG